MAPEKPLSEQVRFENTRVKIETKAVSQGCLKQST
jgi:hypothetical protein